MRFPKMRPQAAMELKVPDLAGGLNLRDGLSEVLDNQLTDCKNVWWQDGVLKTRPGTRTDSYTIRNVDRPTERMANIRNFPEIKYVKSGKTYFLQAIQGVWNIDYNDCYEIRFQFAWQSKNNSISLPTLKVVYHLNEMNYFVCCKQNILYCFLGNRDIYKFDITQTETGWEKAEPHVPIVASFCRTEGAYMREDEILASGAAVEGFNLLSDYYEIQYNAYNPELDKPDSEGTKLGHPMVYSLLKSVYDEKYANMTVKVKYTDASGKEHTHKVTLEGRKTAVENDLQGDNFRIEVSGSLITFFDTNGKPAVIKEVNDRKNNIRIIAPYIAEAEEKAKIFNMTRCEWFGGAASGIAGGTRLFLCGNTGDEKSLVYWSGLNNPLYFPENSYFYVGDTTSAVTGFGKQTDKLVIFKENETWCTYYQQNNNIDANSLINQSVIDYASSSVYFPLVQINSNIGCKYPDTIQLCRNRLVWLSDNGNVYTLVSESQYNERSIFCVSEMVKNKLNKYSGISHPTACDWNGYYCLCFNDEMYLMDYNCYGYTHVASYSKTEDANIRIPWYFWKFAISGVISVIDDKIIFSYYYDGESFNHCAIVNNILSADNDSKDIICYEEWDKDELSFFEKDIESKATTKLFDFGQPSVRKNVDKINLQLGNNGGEPITVKIITECGEENQEITLTGSETQSYTPGYIDSKAVFPCIRQTVKIGLELSSTGVLAIDGMSFKYRTTGGAR